MDIKIELSKTEWDIVIKAGCNDVPRRIMRKLIKQVNAAIKVEKNKE